MTPLCIVPCGKKKIWKNNPFAGPTPAINVYIGNFAGTCICYAKTFYPDSFSILSAKYGFLMPGDLIEADYNVTFKDRKTRPISNSDLIKTADLKGLLDYQHIIAVTGTDYLERIRSVFRDKTVYAPLAGCKSMGEMIRKLKKAIESGRPL